MEQHIRPITFNIYASSDDEAERGRKAIIQFINIMGQHGAKVSGDKIYEAVNKLNGSPFVFGQILKFFKQ
jgi:hypothetical protein